MRRGDDIVYAAKVLARGGLVAFPTETVYGLGADAANDEAVARIYTVKGRPRAHPLIVHVANVGAIERWAEVTDDALLLARAFWPGPLTLILKARAATLATGGSDTLGVRVPNHPAANALLDAFGGGIAAPSANRFGAVSPTTAEHVAADLGDDVDYLLDGGPCTVGVESTIVDLSRGRAVLLRPGGVSREEIERIISIEHADRDAPAAPGTLASHYAPRARVLAVALDEVPATVAASTGTIAILAPAEAFAGWGTLNAITHALPDDVEGMARDLYGALRDLDARGVDLIVAALPPEAGLGEAVADRLRRAAGPK
jgi:L-threonylcarbamoyladenylate synthase